MDNLVLESGTQVAEFNEFAASLAKYKSRYEGVIYDLTVPEQEKQARTDRLLLARLYQAWIKPIKR